MELIFIFSIKKIRGKYLEVNLVIKSIYSITKFQNIKNHLKEISQDFKCNVYYNYHHDDDDDDDDVKENLLWKEFHNNNHNNKIIIIIIIIIIILVLQMNKPNE